MQLSPSTAKSIEAIRQLYDKKRRAIMEDIETNKSQRFEHIHNKDQSIIKFNKGKYAYVHSNQLRL